MNDWTTEKPTEPGYYFTFQELPAITQAWISIVRIVRMGRTNLRLETGDLAIEGDYGEYPIPDGMQWRGPLETDAPSSQYPVKFL